jgi:tight adherence protein C
MPDIGLTATLIAVFAFVALTTGSLVYSALERRSPVRRRVEALRPAMAGAAGPGSIDAIQEPLPAALRKIQAFIPRSPSDMTRLQRRLARAGYHRTAHAVWYGLAQIGFAVAGGLLPIVILGWEGGRLLAVLGVIAGFLVPSVVVERRIKNRQKRIRNGLPDALDLFIVCLEAGLSLDQAILKSAQELRSAHPDLAEELRFVNVEGRAGKPRLEALKNFAKRTQVDDVRALVAMLVQTDRFGTSVAQALRTHAEESRTKRRQRAEERAAKIGVKMVFPLVFFLFPAFFVVVIGPAVIRLIEFFGNSGVTTNIGVN